LWFTDVFIYTHLEHYAEFKEKLHNLFPIIIDTKHLCHGLRRVCRNWCYYEDWFSFNGL